MCNKFFRFDQFLISKMLHISQQEAKTVSEEMRYEAYRACLEQTKNRRIAATQTIKGWFGIGTFRKPRREALIQLFFSLDLSGDEAREWLVKGALEPDFQVNDYNEMIFLYGLQNHLGYEQCQEMIEDFISCLSEDQKMEQHNHTSKMWEDYGKNCNLNSEDFLKWMKSIKEDFKGYSMTVLNYFKDLKTEILYEVKIETGERLEELLGETGFHRTETKGKTSSEARRRAILRYLRQCEKGKKENLSSDLIQCIREMLKMSEMSYSSNAKLLAELYANRDVFRMKDNTRRKNGELRIMDDKYLSEILNVAQQKEEELHMILQGESSQSIQKQKNRSRIIGRQDLLPLILCVSQKRYIREHGEVHYDQVEARDSFQRLAVQILTACNMMPFCPEKFELDAMLYECYEKEEMLSFSEVVSEKIAIGGFDDAGA